MIHDPHHLGRADARGAIRQRHATRPQGTVFGGTAFGVPPYALTWIKRRRDKEK